MDGAARRLPWWRRYSSLDLGRVAALAYSLIGLAALAPQLFTDPRSLPVRPLGIVGVLGLGAVIILTFARRRLFVGEPLLTPALMVLAGVAMADPYATIGLAQRVVPPQSLYGSIASTVVRTVLISVALPLVVVVSPTANGRHSWTSPTVLGNIPSIILLAGLMRVLRASVIRQTQAAERVRLLIATGTNLLNLTDVDRVRAVTASAAEKLCRTAPGTAAILLRLGGEDAVVMGLAGAPRPRLGTRLPAAPWHRVADHGEKGTATEIAALDPYVGRRWWRGAVLDLAEERWLVLVGAAQPVSDDLLDAFALLASQRTEGELKCRAHAELAYRAGHDSVTDLFNRAEFLARLERVIRTDRPAEAAVIVIDLDDFKLVNDTYGHQAGDRMLRIIAGRLSEILSEASPMAGVASRLGGDEFAVLVAADSRDQVFDLTRTIHERLKEPLIAADAAIPVGVSLGVAYHALGTPATELLDNADLAMYRAKESGKNRIAEFRPGMNAVRARVVG